MFKNNGEYSDHRKIFGAGQREGYKKGEKDGFNDGLVVAGAIAGVVVAIGGFLLSIFGSNGKK